MHCSSTARLELEHLANFTPSRSQAGEVAEAELAAWSKALLVLF